ncbi:MAG: hypothetical protein DMG70_15020 [Acidobacteria bacterium]|nr:MAG: hypothetical protein DMG70_15020 [Acidobacteriota bacterium]PYY09360.1 MAG: hypothetical protein DMG69_11265 [Acidobacteriota bacterium]
MQGQMRHARIATTRDIYAQYVPDSQRWAVTHDRNDGNPAGSAGAVAKQDDQLSNWNELERDCPKRAR